MTNSSPKPLRIGLLGLGYWGPNLARNFNRLPDVELAYLCDLSDELRARYAPVFPQTTFTANYDDLLNDNSLDAIVLASPVPTHHALARKSLLAGKHTFVEKPLALTAADADDLANLAAEHDLRLMVDHLLEYHPGVLAVRAMIESGDLGDVLYAYSNRLNLGKFRRDENALWSLGVHDVATLMFLVNDTPLEVSARGESYLHEGVEDVVFGDMKFASGVLAHIHLSWLDPHKIRRLTVVGSRQMVVFDDMEMDRKVTVYDKGFSKEVVAGQGPDGRSVSYGEYFAKREGDIHIPRIPGDEPLRLACQHFADCVRSGETPRSDGAAGARVVHVLEAMQRSLENGGQPVSLELVSK